MAPSYRDDEPLTISLGQRDMASLASQEEPNVIDIRSLTFAYPEKSPIFYRFSWQVPYGESWAVIGPSGCGKTTLLYLLSGMRRPTEGTIIIGGQPSPWPRPGTGLILQDYGLLPWATAYDNVALGLQIRGINGTQRHQLVDTWMHRVGLEDVVSHYPGELSGGQRQRVAIARTLALSPDLLLMDEPFSSLDALTRESLQELVLTLREDMTLTTVIVTHNIEEAVFLGEKILVLSPPPNQEAVVIPNPGVGRKEYRLEPEFYTRCQEIREAIVSQKPKRLGIH